MSDAIQITCAEPVQGHQSIQSVLWPWIKAMTIAGNRVTVRAEKEEGPALTPTIEVLLESLPRGDQPAGHPGRRRIPERGMALVHEAQVPGLQVQEGADPRQQAGVRHQGIALDQGLERQEDVRLPRQSAGPRRTGPGRRVHRSGLDEVGECGSRNRRNNMTPEQLEAMCEAARKRIKEFVARSAGQHRRALNKRWGKAT